MARQLRRERLDWNNVLTRASPGADHSGGENASYLDGHVKWLPFTGYTMTSDPTQ